MAIEKNIKRNVEAKDAIKDVDKLKQGVNDTSKSAADSKSSFAKMTTGVKGLGLAFKALGIGLIVSAFVKLQDALSQNQVFADKVNIALEAVSITFQQIIGTVVEKGQKVIDFFQKTGSAITKFFKKDLDGLNNSFEENNKQTETAFQRNRRLATEIVNLRKEVKLAEAEQRKLQLTYQKEAEIQRQLRDDTNLSIDERIAANTRLGQVLDEQFEKEKELADKKVALAELELSKNKDNVDLQVALINAQTELADLDERITGQRSEQLTNLTSLQNEYNESVKETGIQLKANVDTAVETNDELIRVNDEGIQELIDNEDEKREILAARIEASKAMQVDGAKSILASLGTLAGEGTKMAKATALSQILINTAQSISGAIKAGAGIPFPANLGAIATGVASVLSGIASAKAIFKKVPGGGNDVDTPQNVNTAVQQATGLGALTPNLEGIEQPELGGGQPTVQAFVVENDISNAQALQEELNVQATL